ncbi:hypothetical protein BDC45DRAFT_571130 [Circinella umbellata]|nr:hypothetical protein BDC45DRAFT_576526 [Circinella umbellata]KAI7852534.1 hypothetical protein BDC45DRAFT_571130 [Circinella umbellata]
MVSEFQCPCHGTMRIKNWKSQKLFYTGTNRDGYWTWKDMYEQLEDDVIPLFKRLHPGCQALFLLDQSSNHNDYAPSAKRIETILKEHGPGKWDEYKAQGKYWKAKCGNKEPNSDDSCCLYHMRENQLDFRAQKTALEELVIKAGHLYALYPKYHCDTNWIERKPNVTRIWPKLTIELDTAKLELGAAHAKIAQLKTCSNNPTESHTSHDVDIDEQLTTTKDSIHALTDEDWAKRKTEIEKDPTLLAKSTEEERANKAQELYQECILTVCMRMPKKHLAL